MGKVPKSGKFNVYKNPENYLRWGDLNFEIVKEMKATEDFWVKLIQRVMPKSDV